MKEPEELVDVIDHYYDADPKVGEIVLITHRFEHTTIAAMVVGLKRSHPHRGYDPDNNYEIVVYQDYAIKLAGIRGWLKIGEEEDWQLKQILDDKEYYKMSPDVVLPTTVDDLINDVNEEEEDEL